MKSCVKWGGLLALLLVSVAALGVEYPYQIVKISSTHSVVRIQNTTGGYIPSVLVVFDDAVVVDKALAYGPGAPAVAGIEGANQEWRITFAGKGLPAKAWVDIAFKAGNVPVRFVGPASYVVHTFKNEGETPVPVIAFFFKAPINAVNKALVFGASDAAVKALNGGGAGWRVTLVDGLAPGASLALIVDGTAELAKVFPVTVVAVR